MFIRNLVDDGIIWVTLTAVFLVPLTFAFFRITATFSEPRIITLHLLAGLIVILWCWSVTLRFVDREPVAFLVESWDLFTWAGKNPARWALVATVIMVVFQVASTLLSPLPVISFFGGDEARTGYNLYDSLSMLVIFFAVALKFRSRKHIGLLLSAVISSGTLAAIYGVTQHFGSDPMGYNSEQVRVISSFGNTLNFGAFMVITIPCTLALTYHSRSDNKLWMALITLALGLQLAGLWFTGGRGPYVGLGIGTIAFFALALRILGIRRVVKSAIVFSLGVFIVAILAVLPSPFDDVGLARMASIGQELRGGDTETNSTEIVGGLKGRFQIWGSALVIAKSWPNSTSESMATRVLRPVFGLGPDMFVYSYPLVGKPQTRLQSVDHVHNYPLQILMEQGYAGFSILVGAAGLLLVTMFRVIQKAKYMKLDIWAVPFLALIPAALGKLVEMQAGVNRISDLTTTFAIFGGVIVLFELFNSNNDAEEKDSVGPQNTALSHRTAFASTFLAAVVLTASLITLFTSWDMRRLSASRIIATTFDNPDLKADGWAAAQKKAPERESFTHTLSEQYVHQALLFEEKGDLGMSIQLAETGRKLLLEYEDFDPLEWDVQMLLAKVSSHLVDWGELQYTQEMIDRYVRISELYPSYPSLVGTAATALTSVGEHELAIFYADKAINMESTTQPWSKAWYAKGRALYEIGKEEEAIAVLNIATEKQPGWEGSLLAHQVLSQIYGARGELELADFHKSEGGGAILFTEQ